MDFVPGLEHITKIFFLVTFLSSFVCFFFQAVKVDVRVSRNNFSRGLEMLEMLENV